MRNHAPDIAARAERRGLSSDQLLAVAERHWPHPGWYPCPAGRATLAHMRCPLGLVEQERQL
jgi:hypothetical protein